MTARRNAAHDRNATPAPLPRNDAEAQATELDLERFSLTPPPTPEDDSAVRVYPKTINCLNGSIIEIKVLGATERERANVVEAILLMVHGLHDEGAAPDEERTMSDELSAEKARLAIAQRMIDRWVREGKLDEDEAAPPTPEG